MMVLWGIVMACYRCRTFEQTVRTSFCQGYFVFDVMISSGVASFFGKIKLADRNRNYKLKKNHNYLWKLLLFVSVPYNWLSAENQIFLFKYSSCRSLDSATRGGRITASPASPHPKTCDPA